MISIKALDARALDTPPFVPDWRGKRAHTGSVDGNPKLLSLAAGKTTMGTVSLMSGVLLWGGKRLIPYFDAAFLNELAEAAFAWQFDWRFIDPKAAPHFSPPDQPPEPSAAFLLDNYLRHNIKEERQWHSFFQPVMPLCHMAHLVEYILPDADKQAFADWLKATSLRLNSIAKAPRMEEPEFTDFPDRDAYNAHCAPMRGTPLPPLVLDPETDITGLDLAAEALAFRQTLSPDTNRFLRPAAVMAEMGFKGDPYGASS